MAQYLVSFLPKTEKCHLCVDRTEWNFGRCEVNILVISIGCGDVQLPLYWELLADKSRNSNADNRIALVELCLAVVGKERIGVLIGDREFVGHRWFKYLKGQGLNFIMRIPKHHLITQQNGQSSAIATLNFRVDQPILVEIGGCVQDRRCRGGEGPTAKFEILRGDLAHIMYEHVRERVDYRFGDAVAAVDNGANAVHVRFESGKEEDYALVLVAEGVGSSTREMVFKGENHPRWMDMRLGFFTIPKEESDGTDSRWYNAPGGRCIFRRPDSHGTTRAVLTLQQEARQAENESDEEAKAWLKETFADAGWEAPRVLAGLDYKFTGSDEIDLPDNEQAN